MLLCSHPVHNVIVTYLSFVRRGCCSHEKCIIITHRIGVQMTHLHLINLIFISPPPPSITTTTTTTTWLHIFYSVCYALARILLLLLNRSNARPCNNIIITVKMQFAENWRARAPDHPTRCSRRIDINMYCGIVVRLDRCCTDHRNNQTCRALPK